MRIRTIDSAYNNVANEAIAWNNVVNRFFNNLAYEYSRNGGASEGSQSTEPESVLPIDLWATGEAFQINAYLPGVNPEDVEITFEGDELLIRGKLPAAPEGAEFVKRELYHGA